MSCNCLYILNLLKIQEQANSYKYLVYSASFQSLFLFFIRFPNYLPVNLKYLYMKDHTTYQLLLMPYLSTNFNCGSKYLKVILFSCNPLMKEKQHYKKVTNSFSH